MPQTEEIDMKRRLLTLTASAFILASGIGLAQAQQSTGDRPLPQRDQQDAQGQQGDRKSVVSGKSVAVRVDLGGRRIIKKKKTNTNETRITPERKETPRE